jgi:hypothetical protein
MYMHQASHDSDDGGALYSSRPTFGAKTTRPSSCLPRGSKLAHAPAEVSQHYNIYCAVLTRIGIVLLRDLIFVPSHFTACFRCTTGMKSMAQQMQSTASAGGN